MARIFDKSNADSSFTVGAYHTENTFGLCGGLAQGAQNGIRALDWDGLFPRFLIN